MNALKDLIAEKEDWLVQRVLGYAKRHGYTEFSSTLEEPWRASICGFSEPLQRALSKSDWPLDLPATADYLHESIASFTVKEARLHRQRGIPLSMFLGLTKYYRQAYVDLVQEHSYAGQEKDRDRLVIERFFDHAEIALCSEWTAVDEATLLDEAHANARRLTNEKNKYLTIFESLNDPIIVLDEQGRIEDLNNAAALLFDEAAVPGEGYYAKPSYLHLEQQLGSLIAQLDAAERFEGCLETTQGQRDFDVKTQRFLDVSEKFVGTVLILSDVTEHKRAKQEAEAANRAMSTFLATMSHEIRTPINGILGLANLLQDGPLTETQKEFLAALVSSGEVLLALVNDVLDYSKIEAEAIEVEETAFDLRDLVQQIADLMTASAESKGLQLSTLVEESLPKRVIADQAKLRRILFNLAANAVKFTSAGSVTIAASHSRSGLRFTVQDTGIGISQEAEPDLFKPFTQYAIQGAGEGGGTGLGLAICKKLTEALGGEIGYQSEVGSGSSFWIDLGLQEAAAGPVSSPKPTSATTIGPLSVLLVEDNAVNHLVTEGFLLRDGHQVRVVDSGEAALEAMAAIKSSAAGVDLVLMDIRMDGMGGLEAIRRIRELQNHQAASTPILVLTADLATTQERTCLEAGADLVLGKPFDPQSLRAAVARCLSKGQERVEVESALTRAGDQILDEAMIHHHCAVLGSERTRLIVETFYASGHTTVEAIRKAADAGDAPKVSDLAHSLKSAAGNLGLLRLTKTAQTLETAAGKAPATNWTSALSPLTVAFDQSVAALRRSEVAELLDGECRST